MVSEHVSRHEIICLLGEGGMAEVYLGFFRGPANVNKLVVMKQIRSELARDKRFVTMFLDEARIATRFNHPNVVHTYDVLEDCGRYILTMEYLEGQSFFDVLQRIDLQFFPLEEHLWILTQVLAGLQYAHSLADYDGSPLGVVHRDVSPGNTFVTYDGDVKLLDFGIAKAGGAVSVTQKGTFKGKLNYCAPEQIEADHPPDARADIFAVGVMLWEALARKRIEVGESYAELAHTRLTGKEPRIREIRPEVPSVLADICDRAMAIKPADRYLTAADFQREIERYLDKLGRRVGRAQVAALMRSHFETERRDMQKRIKAHLRHHTGLAAEKSALDDDAPYAEFEEMGARQALTGNARSVLAETEPAPSRPAVAEASTERASPPPAFQKPKSLSLPDPVAVSGAPGTSPGDAIPARRFLLTRSLVLLAVLVGVATAAFGFWWRAPKTASSSAAAPSAMAPPAQPAGLPRPPLPPAPAPASAPAPDTIHLDITVSPPHARLTLDGHAVEGNRLRAEVAKDHDLHVIGASASGFISFGQSVVFSDDLRLNVHLRPDPRRPAGRRRAARVAPVEASMKATPERPAAAWPSKPIDEANPYAP